MTDDKRTNLLLAFAMGISIGYGMLASGLMSPTGFPISAEVTVYGLVNTGLWWVLWG